MCNLFQVMVCPASWVNIFILYIYLIILINIVVIVKLDNNCLGVSRNLLIQELKENIVISYKRICIYPNMYILNPKQMYGLLIQNLE